MCLGGAGHRLRTKIYKGGPPVYRWDSGVRYLIDPRFRRRRGTSAGRRLGSEICSAEFSVWGPRACSGKIPCAGKLRGGTIPGVNWKGGLGMALPANPAWAVAAMDVPRAEAQLPPAKFFI